MIFNETPLNGAYTVDLERRGDDRGFFARAFCQKEFAEQGLETNFVQMNNSLSTKAGVLRGLHFQRPPSAEVKLVRCVSGALFDFIVDLRPDSPSFKQWYGAELTAANRRMMYVPRGFAHAFVTLTDDTEALYLVSAFYDPASEGGMRYDDPEIGISLPIAISEMSEKDRSWPDFTAQDFAIFRGV
jgi:dTDP-4-dehydrorhamnose 3,5-epimerase